MIVTDKNKLTTQCEVVTLKEGEEIAARLLDELRQTNGIGIAANQIGINKRVCIVNVPTTNNNEPIILINPKIIDRSEEMFAFFEGCLSFPDDGIKTVRHKSVTVKADNHNSTLSFEATPPVNKPKDVSHAFECACVQHEIDHLDGITMFDRELKIEPTKRRNKKIGRNEKVTISDGKESKVIKYKKAQQLLEDGWTLVEA